VCRYVLRSEEKLPIGFESIRVTVLTCDSVITSEIRI
jgi:hypothetical protein